MTAPPRARTNRFGSIRNGPGGLPEIWMYDAIDEHYGVSATYMVDALRQAGPGPVTLRINSPGGDAFSGLTIAEAVARHGKVVAAVDGLAASIASVIAVCASRVVMGEGAMIMAHDALTTTTGNEQDHRTSAALLSKVSDTIATYYARKAGGTAAQWREVMRSERWYTAEEAVAAGLADSLADNLREPVSAVAQRQLVQARAAHSYNLPCLIRGSVQAALREARPALDRQIAAAFRAQVVR